MNRNYQKILFAIILLCSSLVFFKTQGTDDVDAWLKLVRNANNYGLIQGYATTINDFAYPPGSSLILFISTKISASLGVSDFVGIKLSMYFYLLITLIIIYFVTENYFLTIISYFLLMISSLGLIYLDIYFTPFLILSLFFLKKKNVLLTTIFYSLASMIKIQIIILMPFFVLQIVNITSLKELKFLDYKKIILSFILPFSLIYITVFIIYGMPYILSFTTGVKENLLSGLATNVGWIMTFCLHYFSPDKFGSLESANYAIRLIKANNIVLSIFTFTFIVSYTIVFIKYFKLKEKSFEKFLLYTTAAFLSYFIFNKGVHENHLYTAVILLIFLYGINKNYFIDMLIWGILFNINMIVFYGFDGRGFNRYDLTALQNPFTSYRVIKYLDLTLLFSFICVAAYFVFISKYIFERNDQLSQNKKLPEGF